MSERPLNPAEIQKDHAIVHYFALLAGIEDVHAQMRLLVSGIASFLRMDAVVLGFADSASHTGRVQRWHAGNASEWQTGAEAAIASSVASSMEEIGYGDVTPLPLIHLGRTVGHLAVGRRDPPRLAAEEEFLLSSFQSLAALLLSNDAERRHAEAAIGRRNRVLNGINRIFEEALASQTDEELGRTCLQVAEEITSSKFGFVGEIGADGFLHDIAVSDPGWAACAMHDQSGHRRPHGNFRVRGLYGRVLQDGESLLTNTPGQHPDSVGTPPGHPALTAFLGVPLVEGGRTIGMIAVANRDGGYGQEELESLEALAPAMVQALHRKRTEQALIRSEKLVSVGRLAATIAHEINNPLEAATNAIYLVRKDKALSSDNRAMARVAERELRRAAQIARRTLGFYREPNARIAVRAAELLTDVIGLYESRIRGKNLDVRLRCADRGAAVVGNPGELRQLFANLLANSIDATPEGGIVHVRVGSLPSAKASPFLRITIADTGAGIEPHHVRRLFEPFFTTKKDIGTGLGLWISEQIVKKHGGAIRVRSRVGHGSVFRVRLPAVVAQPARAAARAAGD